MKKAYLVAPGRMIKSRGLQWSYHLAKNLKRIGTDSVIFMMSDNNNFSQDNIKFVGVKVGKGNRHMEELIFSLKLIPRIIKNRRNMLFIHINGFFPDFVCSIMAKFLNIPCVTFCTDNVEEIYKSSKLPLAPVISKMAFMMNYVYAKFGDVIVSDSQSGKKWITKAFGVNEDKILTTPHGFDPKIFYPIPKNKELIKKFNLEGKIVLGFHGDIGHHDGMDDLFKSIKYLGNYKDKIKILIVGNGIKIADMIREMKLEDTVVFTGWVDYEKVPEYLSLCDVYIVPWKSTKETNIAIPRKILEAMGMGLPLMTSRIEAVASEFKDGSDSVMFKPENPKDLAEKLLKVLKDNELRKRLGKRSYELSKRYMWDAVAKKEIEFLKERKLIK